MTDFAALFAALDETTKTTEKVAALRRYFSSAEPADAAWAVYFLTGRKLRQVVPTKLLRQWAAEVAGVSPWLFEECYHAVGDLAETMALLVPPATQSDPRPLHRWVEEELLPLRGAEPEVQRAALVRAWEALPGPGRFVWNKLITGAFRVGVSQLLVVRALAEVANLPAPTVAHRLMGEWSPTASFYAGLIAPVAEEQSPSRPYPFYLATPLEDSPADLGSPSEWVAEWKWDGIRSQLIRRAGEVFLWSRGEELVTERFPEIAGIGARLPEGTVLDGEVLPWGSTGVRPFADLQRRIGRKTLTKKILTEVPVVLLAYDLLEWNGEDWRERPLQERRRHLEQLVARIDEPALRISTRVEGDTWDDLARIRTESRQRQVEGLMLKRASSPYRVGRVRGDWWKWKIDPFAIDAVLIYAQRGSGKRASLYTDYTFGLWHEGKLVPFAKAYSGLTDAEIRQVDAFVRASTVEKFGPVRTVAPELVFEIGFEGIQRSTRHKSGVTVRFPRMLRWRKDKPASEADTLEAVQKLLPGE